MDNTKINIELYQNITDKLYKSWLDLYEKGAGYNLSPLWCKTWLNYFGNPQNIKIITIWENKELKLLAPFYFRKNKLTLIGTKPDLYDEFNILYCDKKYIEDLIIYIRKNNFQLNFRHLDAESEFSKELIHFLSDKGINQESHVDETRFFIQKDENFKPPTNFRHDVSRRKRKIAKDTGNEFIFEFKAEKSNELINEFIKFHTHRWGGGMLENNLITEFLKEILKNNDSAILSRLYLSQSGETAALGIGYIDSTNKYTHSLTTYNNSYRQYSPGKIILNELINAVFENEINSFDMGRGSESYKNRVANEQSILFSIKTNSNPKYYKLQRFVNKVLDLVFY